MGHSGSWLFYDRATCPNARFSLARGLWSPRFQKRELGHPTPDYRRCYPSVKLPVVPSEERKVKTIPAIFCILFLSITSQLCFAQNSHVGKDSKRPSQNEHLAKPIDWGEQYVRLFTDSNVLMTFKLATSWIPGQDHKGMFRYKIDISPKMP